MKPENTVERVIILETKFPFKVGVITLFALKIPIQIGEATVLQPIG